MTIEIRTERFQLRELTLEDVSERYLSWLNDPRGSKYIPAADHTRGLADVRAYVEERVGRDDVLFLAIVDRASGLHVGNIKYEPLDIERGFAVMGILIGEPDYWGKGVACEVLEATAAWLKEHRQVLQIVLGVESENRGAIRAFEKAGFVASTTPHVKPASSGAITMVWDLVD